MNYAIYIAAAVVMVLLIGLVVLSISWLQKTVLRNIRSKTMGLLSAYDELLEEKSRALNAMETPAASVPVQEPAGIFHPEDQQAVRELSEAMLASVQRSVAVPFRDAAMGGTYRVIRENFSYDLQQVLPALEKASVVEAGTATGLLKKLDYDIVYQLSTLDGSDQKEILRSVLNEKEAELLEAYEKTSRDFSALGFYDHLQSQAASEPGPARLLVAADVAAAWKDRVSVEVIADPDICEGYQIEQDNRLYDFSIKTRELS